MKWVNKLNFIFLAMLTVAVVLVFVFQVDLAYGGFSWKKLAAAYPIPGLDVIVYLPLVFMP